MALKFPGKCRCAKDGGVRFLERGVDQLHLVSPQRKNVGVHGIQDGLREELLAAGQAAEEDYGLRGAELDEIGKLLAKDTAGVVEDLMS